MTSLDAVLDACVLYPMYLRDTSLRVAETGLYEARWSADSLLELRRNLVADILTEEKATRLLGAMVGAFPDADLTFLMRTLQDMKRLFRRCVTM